MSSWNQFIVRATLFKLILGVMSNLLYYYKGWQAPELAANHH